MEDGEDIDFISDLPDAVLHLILSLIPTKSIITTSSISKRWRQITADHLVYACTLDFGEDFAKNQRPNQFTENLNRILAINKSEKIGKFRLFFSPRNEEHKSNATTWLRFATSRGVQEIDLDFCRHIHIHFLSRAHVVGKKEAFELPDFLFDCKSLLTVKLSRCILGLPEKYAGFGGLQTLCLKEVHVTDSMLESLISNCSLLEVLVLKECKALSSIRILSPKCLKILTVYECYNASVLEISGPNIRSLLISAGHLDACKVEDMSMLEEVFIGTRGDEFGGVFNIFMKVLSDLSHVRALYLYLGHLVPSLIKDFQVEFSNLQELWLVNSPLFGLFNSDVYCFFRHCTCPSLQKLFIEKSMRTFVMLNETWCGRRPIYSLSCKTCLLSTVSEEENFIWEYRKPNVTPVECVFHNLRTVTLRNFRGTSSDVELAAFFLQRAPILEWMFLIAPQSLTAEISTVKDGTSCSTLTGNATIGVSCPSSKGMETKGMKKAVYEKLLHHSKVSSIAEIRVSESEHDTLLSFFKWHHVSDVYHKE